MNASTMNLRAGRLGLLMAALVLLTACTQKGDFTDLQRYFAEVKARPGGPVEPIPTFEPYEAFTYSAASLRSPFDVPLVAQFNSDGSRAEAKKVQPNLEREREPLESHALSDLSMVGMLLKDNAYTALIKDETNAVHRIRVGNYLGRNFGRVTNISPDQVDIVEIVPSGDGGWVERPQTMTLE